MYEWSSGTQDLPGYIEAKHPSSLPKDVQFTDEATLSLFNVGLEDFANIGLSKIFEIWESWDSLDDFRNLITPVIDSSLPDAAEYWRDDVWVGSQFLNGSNPEVIKKCEKLPENFPVKNEMVDMLLDRGYDLKKAIDVTKIICFLLKLLARAYFLMSRFTQQCACIYDLANIDKKYRSLHCV